MASRILSIPAELQCLITPHLNDPDLLTTRLAHRQLTAACDCPFISRFIKSRCHFYTRDSLQTLLEISQSAFAPKLKAIEFIPLSTLCPDQFHEAWRRSKEIRDWCREDDDFWVHDQGRELLVQILDNVGAAGGRLRMSVNKSEPGRIFGAKPLLRAILEADGYFAMRPIAACNSGIAIKAVNEANAAAKLPPVGLDILHCKLAELGESAFPPLRQLTASPWRDFKKLKFFSSYEMEDSMAELFAGYLKTANGLEELHACVNFYFDRTYCEKFVKMLSKNTPALRSVFLEGYSGSVEILLNFLFKHRSTVRDLSLRMTRLWQPGDEERLDCTTIDTPGSTIHRTDWQILFKTLTTFPRLEGRLSLHTILVPNPSIRYVGYSEHFQHFYVGDDKLRYCSKRGRGRIVEFLHKLEQEGHFTLEDPDSYDGAKELVAWPTRDMPDDEEEAYGESDDEEEFE